MADLSQKLSISVVVCAFNEQDWIGKTLASLVQQKRLADEIIVVNNASTDDTQAIVEGFIADHLSHNIKIVQQPQKGLHHAREAGWRATQSHSDIVVMTDADILFPADWLQIVEKSFADAQ